MNNIPELLLEQVEPKEVRCIICDEEIYENQLRFCTDEGAVCGPDSDCIFRYLQEFCFAEEVATAMHIPLTLE